MQAHRVGNTWRPHLVARIIFINLLGLLVPGVLGDYGTFVGQWNVSYASYEIESGWASVGSNKEMDITIRISNVQLQNATEPFYFQVQTTDDRYAVADQVIQSSELTPMFDDNQIESTTATILGTTEAPLKLYQWEGVVNLQGRSEGYTQLFVNLKIVDSVEERERAKETLHVIVTRQQGLNKSVFSIASSVLSLFIFANLGTALDLEQLKVVLHRPIGPAIGFCMRYVLMPPLALGIGWLAFHQRQDQQIALLFTALAPSGGLANVSTVFLRGNINLIVSSTTINCLLGVAMLPIWIIAIVPEIFTDITLAVPFLDLASGTFMLIGAIAIGALMRAIRPNSTQFVFKYLKPCCMVLMICLVGTMVGFNVDVFQYITPDIICATLLQSVLAYMCSFGISRVCRRSFTDALTLSVQTGVVNTMLPITLLQYSMGETRAAVVTIVPIMASLLSFGIVVVIFIIRRIFGWRLHKDPEAFDLKNYYVEETTA